MGEVVLLALTASLNPSLLTATTLMLLLDRPARLMAGYLAGAYMTSITVGLVIVFSLSGSSATTTVQHTISPLGDIALGLLLVMLALVVRSAWPNRLRERRRARAAGKPEKGPARWQRVLSGGSPRAAFAIGAVLTLPGASALAGLYSIHKLNASVPVTVLLVIGFSVVMLWLLEVPLVSYVVAPEWTPETIARAKQAVARHARTFTVRGLELVGLLLILRGVLGLIR